MVRLMSVLAVLAAAAVAHADPGSGPPAPAGAEPVAVNARVGGETDEGPTFLNGAWAGKGYAIRDQGISDCPLVSASFEIKDNLYKIITFKRSCMEAKPGDGQPKLSEQAFPPVTVTARDGKILDMKGKQVGTYANDFVDIRYEIPIGNVVRLWRTRLVLKGSVVQSDEDDSFTVAGASQPAYFLVYTGLMTKVN